MTSRPTLHRTTPDLGPRESGDKHEENPRSNEGANPGVTEAKEATVYARRHESCSRRVSRDEQVVTGDRHHERPACRKLHEHAAPR